MALYYTERRLGSRFLKVHSFFCIHARSILRAFHVKIIVRRSLNLAVGRLLKKKKMRFGRFLYSMLATFYSYFGSISR